MKALKFYSLALAGLLVGSTLYVGDAEAARKRMSAKPAPAAQAKSNRYGSSASQARPAAPAQNAAPAPARGAAPASAAAPAQAAPQAGGAGSGFMGSMAGAVAGSVIGGAVVNTLFADDAVAEEAPAAEQAPEEALAQ